MEIVAWAKPAGRAASSGANRLVSDALRVAEIDPNTGERYWALVEEHALPVGLAEYRRAKASVKAYVKEHGVTDAKARLKATRLKYDIPDIRARVQAADGAVDPEEQKILEQVDRDEATIAAYEALPEVQILADVAKVRAKASNRASLVQNGRLKPFKPEGSFKAASRTEQEVEGSDVLVVRVYAQYVGDDVSTEVDTESVPA